MKKAELKEAAQAELLHKIFEGVEYAEERGESKEIQLEMLKQARRIEKFLGFQGWMPHLESLKGGE